MSEKEAPVNYPRNPLIEEACEHYPKRLGPGEATRRAIVRGLGMTVSDDCQCGDCFYCDGD